MNPFAEQKHFYLYETLLFIFILNKNLVFGLYFDTFVTS
ncbi:hypothetical protein ACIVBQ_001138 [Tenacibaculum discolor]